MKVCCDTTRGYWPIEDIRCILSDLTFCEFFFIDKILTNTRTLDDLLIRLFGIGTIIFREQ